MPFAGDVAAINGLSAEAVDVLRLRFIRSTRSLGKHTLLPSFDFIPTIYPTIQMFAVAMAHIHAPKHAADQFVGMRNMYHFWDIAKTLSETETIFDGCDYVRLIPKAKGKYAKRTLVFVMGRVLDKTRREYVCMTYIQCILLAMVPKYQAKAARTSTKPLSYWVQCLPSHTDLISVIECFELGKKHFPLALSPFVHRIWLKPLKRHPSRKCYVMCRVTLAASLQCLQTI